tara:strand:+ start:275 stop:502 length:228 start_codon:yes stop_codon:yes gene_type:complete
MAINLINPNLKANCKLLLQETDWTDLPNNNLTTACKAEFQVWRNLIRDVVLQDPLQDVYFDDGSNLPPRPLEVWN